MNKICSSYSIKHPSIESTQCSIYCGIFWTCCVYVHTNISANIKVPNLTGGTRDWFHGKANQIKDITIVQLVSKNRMGPLRFATDKIARKNIV